MEQTKIEWTDRTFNPIIVKGGGFYCFKVSPACKNCYAENMARRVATMQGNTAEPYTHRWHDQWPELELKRGMLAGWAKKRDGKMNFVSSMTDIFGEFVPDSWVFEILDAMYAAPRQTFQMLTKREERCFILISVWLKMRHIAELPEHMWIGMSVEDQIRADQRIPWLIKIPAKVRFVSCEPLLTKINFIITLSGERGKGNLHFIDALRGAEVQYYTREDGSCGVKIPRTENKISWVIIGGESGNRKTIRPMNPEYAADIVAQCKSAGTAVFFKQHGEYIHQSQSMEESFEITPRMLKHKHDGYIKTGKHLSGALLDGKAYKEFPNQLY